MPRKKFSSTGAALIREDAADERGGERERLHVKIQHAAQAPIARSRAP